MPRPRKKIKLTWTELRQQRNALERFELYLPTLQLKQQQLQSAIFQARREHYTVKQAADVCAQKISTYRAIFNDTAGFHVVALSDPEDIMTDILNIAGVRVPVFESAAFPQAAYSLFGSSSWVDQALADLREQNLRFAELEIIDKHWTSFGDLPLDREGNVAYQSKEQQRIVFEGYYGKEVKDSDRVLVLGFRIVQRLSGGS